MDGFINPFILKGRTHARTQTVAGQQQDIIIMMLQAYVHATQEGARDEKCY